MSICKICSKNIFDYFYAMCLNDLSRIQLHLCSYIPHDDKMEDYDGFIRNILDLLRLGTGKYIHECALLVSSIFRRLYPSASPDFLYNINYIFLMLKPYVFNWNFYENIEKSKNDNIEHVYPKSINIHCNYNTIDLFNLLYMNQTTNTQRQNYPYCECKKDNCEKILMQNKDIEFTKCGSVIECVNPYSNIGKVIIGCKLLYGNIFYNISNCDVNILYEWIKLYDDLSADDKQKIKDYYDTLFEISGIDFSYVSPQNCLKILSRTEHEHIKPKISNAKNYASQLSLLLSKITSNIKHIFIDSPKSYNTAIKKRTFITNKLKELYRILLNNTYIDAYTFIPDTSVIGKDIILIIKSFYDNIKTINIQISKFGIENIIKQLEINIPTPQLSSQTHSVLNPNASVFIPKKLTSPIQISTNGGSLYYQKYIKYKSKYLNLLNKNK